MYWHPSEGDPAGIGMTVVYFWRLSNLPFVKSKCTKKQK